MKRIALFLATNVAILVVMSITLQLIGFEGYMDQQGINLDLQGLLIFSAVFGFSGSLVSLLLSKWTAKRFTGARVIEKPANSTEQWLVQTVRIQSEQAGIKMPEVAIFDTPDVNAFATGRSRNNSLVAVSSGLLNAMTQDEAEAVIAHEISHVANGDMITMALIQGVVNTFVIFLSRVVGHFVDRVIFKNQRGHGIAFYVTSIFAQVVLGILASTITMWFSRQREFRADAGSAQLTDKRKMIAALERLKANSNQPELPDQLAAFGIAGGMGQGIKRFFMSHPPLDERIAALKSMT